MVFLVRHPDTPAGAIQSIEARLERVPEGVVATFIATGDIGGLRLPSRAGSVRADNLWRSTCFELFVSFDGGAYREFNLSPSGAWAAYDFTGYREEMRHAPADVLIRADHDASRLILLADIQADFPPYATVGMTAVVDEADEIIRYWATSFEPGKPDFHAPGVRSLLLGEVDAE
ncbi:hypothetical protein G7076_05430 [Sphingomonas sp. HDW15A]|uniref:hypothetical protein n=1 Tax=Sphingomonas sp. HDW15A TaxID=2714942 RepID=UPI00140E78AF|nr:hypothetical protein [Sphingomonas sp. HDW15A]QIK95977.1 hypothetical protein G7076_05430 [Sphingomonas sp. HDW15A]